MESEEVFVHINHIPKGNKYQVVAPLSVVFQDVEFSEEIVAECPGSHTVGGFVENIKERIINVIQDKFKELSKDSNIEEHVEVCLRRKRQQGYKVIPHKLNLTEIMTQDQGKTRIKIFDREFRILLNRPTICNLLLPPVLYAPFAVCPVKFDGLNIKNIHCKFSWYRSKDKITWEQVDNTYFYAIKMEDVGYYLKMCSVPVSKEGLVGSCVEVISKDVVKECPEVPQNCPFLLRHDYTKHTLSEQSFRIVSYNTLSSRYTYYNDTYSYCQDEFIAMDYRKRLILKEILGYNADIICLQEIDLLEYYRFFEEAFRQNGYVTKYYRKGFYLSEGLLCAVRLSRFKLKSYEQIVFCHALKHKPKIYEQLYEILREDAALLKKISVQSSSMVILMLKLKGGGRILVGNIHLSHHPLNDDIRLIHSFMAIRFLKYTKQRLRMGNRDCKINIVLCGDFNSLPNSVVHDFICKGKLERKDYLKVSDRLLDLRHNLRLKSACGSPKYTSYSPSFKNCIDYIFVEEGMTEINQVVPFMEEELEKYSGIPNQVYPSDHLALVVDMKVKEKIYFK